MVGGVFICNYIGCGGGYFFGNVKYFTYLCCMKKKVGILKEEEVEKVDYSSYSLGGLQEVIGRMEENVPLDKRKKEFREYVAELNSLFNIYNSRKGEKIYRKIVL